MADLNEEPGGAPGGVEADAAAVDPVAELEQRAEALESEVAGEGDPGVAPEPETASVPTEQILLPVISAAFAILAPAWQVSAGECRQLAQAWAVVVDKYFPDLPSGPELQAVIITLAVVGPRLGKPRREPEPEKREEGEGAGGAYAEPVTDAQ